MTKRAKIFEDVLELDVSNFSPKSTSDKKAPTPEQVRAVTAAANFPSREASPASGKAASKRAIRIHRTGRNVQFNIKALQETVEKFYAITDAHPGWVLGYTLERAVAALTRELESES